MTMHKAVARDILRKGGWSDPQITMALRILAHDGARAATDVAGVLGAFGKRCEDGTEAAAWAAIAARVEADGNLAAALWALRAW